MAFWWVSQNQTFRHERAGGYLWAPTVNKGGTTPFHWQTMRDVRAGDIVFSFVGQTIRAVSVAAGAAYPSNRPPEFTDQDLWKQDGFQIDVSYEDVTPALAVPPIAQDLRVLLPSKYSPLTRDGTGSQGYLFALPDRAGRFIFDALGGSTTRHPNYGMDLAIHAIERAPLPETEKQRIIQSRIGQGRFRSDLLEIWDGRCAVTGTSLNQLLRASHIKPWASSNNMERTDPKNGLLLAANYDAAFDSGLIGFDGEGNSLIHPGTDFSELRLGGIDPSCRLRRVLPGSLLYLDFHRREVMLLDS